MATARTLAFAMAFSFLPLLGGCGDSTDKGVEEKEPESIRQERRMKHEQLAPKDARSPETGTVKK
jgi:hypothetical protein